MNTHRPGWPTAPERYAELRPETREFIDGLHGKRLEYLDKAIEFAIAAETMGRFAKWLLLGLVGLFVAGAGIAKAVGEYKAWWGAK